MQRHQVRCRHPILSPHLADHELRIAADPIRVPQTSLPLEFLEVAKQEDETLIFRNVVAPHRAGRTRKVRHFADDPGLAHDERGSHRSLGPELISRACSVEETRDPGCGGRRHQPRGRRALQDLRLVGDRFRPRNRKEGRRALVRIASGKAFARQPQHPQQVQQHPPLQQPLALGSWAARSCGASEGRDGSMIIYSP